MRARVITVVGLVLSVLAVLAVSWATRRGDGGAAVEPHNATHSGSNASDTRIDEEHPTASVDASRRETGALSDPAETAPSPPSATDRRLRGRVVDTLGKLVAGASVVLWRSEADGQNSLDVELARSHIDVAATESDARGEFAFDVEASVLYRLQARNRVAVSSVATSCCAGAFVELVLEPMASLRGRVTLAGNGWPVSGAAVELRSAEARMSIGDATGTDGAFSIQGLKSGEWLLTIDPGDSARPLEEYVTIREGQQLERDFVLEPGPSVSGSVTDATTGAPIAGAEVSQSWTFERSVRTSRDGEYTLRHLARGRGIVTVRAAGYGRLESSVDADHVAPDTRHDFALTPARLARGRIVDEGGRALSGVYVAAGASDLGGDTGLQRMDWSSSTSGGDGRFELRDLRPDLRHVLLLRKRGLGTAVYDFPDDEFERRELDFGDVVMPSASNVDGFVLDDAGTPLAGERVQLDGAHAARTRFGEIASDERWLIDSYIAEREVRSDQLGRFEFADVAPGAYVLRLQRRDAHEHIERAITVERGAATRDVRLIVPTGLAIAGRVTSGDDGPLPTVYVSADPEGEGRSGDVQVGPDGRFRVTGLDSVSYTLNVYPYETETDHRAGRVFLTTVVEHVSAGTGDVAITLRRGALIRGRVLDLDGAPVDSAQVLALDIDGEHLDQTVSAIDGSFALEVPLDGLVDLVSANTPTWGESIDARPDSTRVLGVAPGSANVEIRIRRTP
ncbi:MAG: carboxypeptidase regulatory-like domain-containing protein [Planctomycetes bacterium]|nr:carboxypeptidase regulatory-like domain-containing protein [Planctomycetota bacterium]